MQLYLIRHGIAFDRTDPACPPDPQRPLTERGFERTRGVAAGLVRLGVEVDAVWTSPYLRAEQTAEIVAHALDFSPDALFRTDALLPDAPPALLVEQLLKRRPSRVACVGHNPNLEWVLAHVLANAPGSIARLKKASAVLIDLDERGRGELQWLLPPRVLRQIARA